LEDGTQLPVSAISGIHTSSEPVKAESPVAATGSAVIPVSAVPAVPVTAVPPVANTDSGDGAFNPDVTEPVAETNPISGGK